ncbi:MAG: hypothetical protein P1P88_22520 [Bacteroidales bacterium]|nr:hypothetical protein [Bacteroidales bacterium]
MNIIKNTLAISFVIFTLNINAQELIINDAATLEIDPSARLILSNGMSLVNHSSLGNLNGTFVFKGTLPQKIYGSQPVTFAALNIEEGAFVDLNNNVNVSGELNLNLGIVNLLDHNLRIGDGAVINGTYSDQSMISADGAGKLEYEISANGTYFYPVGDTSGIDDYSPATLTFNSGTYTNAVVGINLKNMKHPNNSSSTDYLNRYWTVSDVGLTDIDCDVIFGYTNEDIVGTESNMYGGQWDGTYWTALDQVSLYSVTGTVQSFSDFTAGELAILSVEEKTADALNIIVNGKNIIMQTEPGFPIDKIEVFNKLGQHIFTKIPANALYFEFSLNEQPDFYLLRLSSDEKSITKKIYIW